MEKTIEEVLNALETNQIEKIDYDVLNTKDLDPEEHWYRYFKQKKQRSNILIFKPDNSNDVSTILKLANKLKIQISVLGGTLT